MNEAIGVFGGTFDPIHLGHITLLQNVLNSFAFLEIKIIPCKLPVHKEAAIATTQQRLDMITMAIKSMKKVSIDKREILRTSDSYAIETLQSLKKENPNTPLIFILGSDSFNTLNTWHRWQELLNYAHILVVKRPNAKIHWQQSWIKDIQKNVTTEPARLYEEPFGRIYFFETNTPDISSTMLKQRLKTGETLEAFLSPKVSEYITKHAVYKKIN